MRASTMFALVIAVLIGLGVTAAAKYAGFFDKPPAPEVKQEEILVLVSATNLFENMTLTSTDVRVRPLKKSEQGEWYKANEKRLLPAQVSAASLRVLARSVEADQPLMKEHLQDLAFAQSVTERLAPGMRAVDLHLPKERASGGMLRVGERADVFMTATITSGEKGEFSTTRTAIIARDLKVITKRNTLWQVSQADPDNQLISYQLETNPYRAALIEYAKQRGTLSLAPTPANMQRAPQASTPGAQQSFADSRSKEYKDEDVRVAAINNGEMTVGDNDLERIFDFKPPLVNRPAPPIGVEMISGVNPKGVLVYPPASTPLGASPGGSATGAGADSKRSETSEPPITPGANVPNMTRGPVSFSVPGTKKDCPTCGKDNKQK